MSTISFVPIDTATVEHYWALGDDANGQIPEVQVSDGELKPCRHCLGPIAAGERYLILAHRPFPNAQPYAEVGPIFLHADGGGQIPGILSSLQYIVRGYGTDDRIVYGMGKVTDTPDIPAVAAESLARADIEYVHVRSASNNCFQCRVDRA